MAGVTLLEVEEEVVEIQTNHVSLQCEAGLKECTAR